MIYVKEEFMGNDSVAIHADGTLDSESVLVLRKTCEHHLKEGKVVILNLKGLLHITREGRKFLQEVKDKVFLENSNPFLNEQNS